MHPLTVGPAPHVLAGGDDRAAARADLSRGVCLIVSVQGTVPVLMTHPSVLLRGAAQIFLHPLLDLMTSEIWWGCHIASITCDDDLTADSQCGIAAAGTGAPPGRSAGRPGASHSRPFSGGSVVDQWRARMAPASGAARLRDTTAQEGKP
jgi:hypothetical protein